jgi:hypothetical protein
MANDFGRAGVKTPKGLKAANVRTNRTGKNKDIRSAKKRDKILASSPAAKKRKKKRIVYEHPLAKAFNGENDISFFSLTNQIFRRTSGMYAFRLH